jgi:adenylylsulfate kinase
MPSDSTPPRTGSTNIVWHAHTVTRQERERRFGHRGCTVWLTGLSGSGKSTLANALDDALWQRGIRSYVLDGDNVRHGLNRDLGFSPEDRAENIRRIGEVARLFTDAGIINTTAFISPYRADRAAARAVQQPGDFIEVYVRASLETCEGRDTKGLYAKARAGQIKEFTGISAPYEEPEAPEVVVDTDLQTVEESLAIILGYLEREGYVPPISSGS